MVETMHSISEGCSSEDHLALLASEIRQTASTVEEYEKIGLEALGRLRVAAAIKAGKLLLSAKEKVPHGQWQIWLKENVSELSQSTACRWMKLAEEQKLSALIDLENRKLTEIYESFGKGIGADNEPQATKRDERNSSESSVIVKSAIALKKKLVQFNEGEVGLSEGDRNQLDLIWTEIQSKMAALLGRTE